MGVRHKKNPAISGLFYTRTRQFARIVPPPSRSSMGPRTWRTTGGREPEARSFIHVPKQRGARAPTDRTHK